MQICVTNIRTMVTSVRSAVLSEDGLSELLVRGNGRCQRLSF
jgi:hypothetical protein